MKIKTYQKEVENKKDKIFFVLSDLHIASYRSLKKLKMIKEKLEKQKKSYDAIFVVGDIIDSTNTLKDSFVTNELLSFFSYLGSLAPTYIAIGNHDVFSHHTHTWRLNQKTFQNLFLNPLLKIKNIYFLDNETKDLKDNYTLSVLNPPKSFLVCPSLKKCKKIILETYENSFLKNLKPDQTNIVICHYPDILFWLYQKGHFKNVDLAIGGHNHSGITQFLPIELFFHLFGAKNRGIITPSKSIHLKDTKYLRGWVDLDAKTSILMNPSITTFAPCSGFLKIFDKLFYASASAVHLSKNSKNKKKN